MSWLSASPDSIPSESSQQEIAVAEPRAWGHRGAGHGIDDRDWFGAFYVPQNDLASITPEWPPSAREESESVAQESTEEQLQSCISCGTPTQELQQLSCGHLWGRACLIARIELALQGFGLNWPARCCQKIDEDEMKSLAPFLGESVVQMYLNKYEEMETPRDQRIYCANPRCSVFLGQREKGAHLDACLECGTSTCLSCGNMEPLHDHDECPSETTRVSHQELINSGKLQQCPGCPEVVELREACNHITCLCGTEFCFSCGQFWRTCYCALYPGVEDETEEGHQDEAAEAAEEAFAAARATCLHPMFNNATRQTRCEYCGHSSGVRMYKCARCRTAACYDCYDRLNMFAIGASALRQEAALWRANIDRQDELGD
ncbi:hypothetical protein GJ744_006082 [Endocarpon pusillum]|uniref:RBR-type E3 ubiquitin transferase n=1 Tax=Endocarpon pusillum TaxID=364733 RepID=A0A8H7E8F8_9EURO|nr:hypothetical protein GJ744_006082 [Endocarpon pusillum]